MFLSKLSVRRPVLVSMAILVFVVFGIIAYTKLPLNLMPDVSLPFVMIQTVYPGAGPSEVEIQVTKPIEDAIATVSLVDYTQSYSLDNASIILIAFKMQKNVDLANQEIKDKVDGIIRDLPASVEKPLVQKINYNAMPFMDLILTGKQDGRDLYELADAKLKDRFGQIDGVGQVEITGGNKRQIEVKLSDKIILENRISLSQLMQILAAQNLDMPAGSFQQGSQEYSVKLKGRFDSVESVGDADIPTATGFKKLRDLGEVTDGIEEVRNRAIYYNVPSRNRQDNIVRISLTGTSDGNVVSIAKEVRDRLPELRKELPAGVRLDLIRDESDFIRGTVDDTFNNIWLGILLTGLILLIFLHDLRATAIVALSMPISIISTFVFMQIAGFSFNLLTLIGISSAVGILVTNSVIVIENIFRHRSLQISPKSAAEAGASEIALAVLASTLTNIVVFIPIASMGSLVGVFFREFALTVAFATVFSLITAFTVTPMLSSFILGRGSKVNRFGAAFDRIFDKFSAAYAGFLSSVLSSKKHSRNIILITVALVIGSLALIPVVGLEFMPPMDQGELTISAELPEGYNLDQTAEIHELILERLARHREIEHVITNLGSLSFIETGTNLASLDVKLIEADKRRKTSRQIAALLTSDLADIPNARISVSASSSSFGEDSGIEFYLQGQETAQLEKLKLLVWEKISGIPGLVNLDAGTRNGRTELTIIPRRDQMAAVGATVYDLALALRGAVEGIVSTQYHEAGRQFDIKVSLFDADLDTPQEMGNMNVVIMGQPYLLSQLAELEFGPGTNRIIHRDRSKSVVFTADIAENTSMGEVISQINKRIDDISFPAGYRIVWGGNAQMLKDAVIAMLQTFILAVLLTYMLLAAILESFVQPLFIMGTVPLALIGVVFALLATGQTFNIVSMMSVIMLVGIVVNNAILLLDYANLRRKQGVSPHDALMEAGQAKVKPIIMSTLAIVIGMLPMALGIGEAGKEMRMPMGIVSIGGLIASTFLTLIIIPAFYYLTSKQAQVIRESSEANVESE